VAFYCRLAASFFLGLPLILATDTLAAPPKMDFLFPAGGARGMTVSVTANGTFEKWPVQAWCDRPGITVAAADEKGKLSVTIPADAAPGVAWIRLYDAEGATALKPFVVGLLPEIVEVEPNNEVAKPQAIGEANATVNGRLEKNGDVDCIAVPLKAGQTFVASVEAHRTLGSPMDGILQIVSPAGFVLEQNDDDHGLDPQIVFQVPADGTYTVRTMAFPAETSAAINFAGAANYVYRLTLTTGGFVDHVWPMAVSTSGPAEVQVFGWNIPESAQRLPVLVPSDAPSVTLFSPQLTNGITVPVELHAAIAEAQRDGARELQELPIPVTITGRIAETRETDTYRIALKKGEAVHLLLEARAFGSPLDPVLTVADASGKTIQRVDDTQNSRDAELNFTAPGDGQYLVQVADLHRRGGWRFVYRLTISRPQPDFTATVAADSFTVTPGKPLEIPVTIERTAGFSEEIEFTAADIPEGVTVESVKSLSNGDTAKAIKLVIAATAGPRSGILVLVGKSTGDLKLVRQVQVPLIGAARTSKLWLTVTAPK
jgi:hypothetical protein